ncbi:hypothetical protein CAP39_04985 [Sphingomonas sp. IBVSS1]|uniref:SH3 domain-containing protein n=1 Tax=Sandarakinorhabdus cyanobacteriorum TaxID=1981098 RepID=A0A255YPL0_9SPHN|nr:SH3 domain-containing protein [Sandarakinorhabdus cyanobacteriorum]OSZ72671.1 hypothetical protein CAP39_04985 [Sphingomonas sp. IBVSS1]OYQ31133.1 SH3 domain-containing protein [Sandarakinorhabdus cyanobacteriorum]
MAAKKLIALGASLALALMFTLEAPAHAGKAPKFTDACQVKREPFNRIKNYRLNKTFEGGAKGIAIGIGLALLNEAFGPKERYIDQNGQERTRSKIDSGAIILGAGAIGALKGNLDAREQAAAQRADLQKALAEQAGEAMQAFSPLGQQLADLGACRREQIAAVAAAKKAGEIDAKEGERRLGLIKKWIAEDDKIIDAAAKKQTKFVEGYSVAYARNESGDQSQTFDGAALVREAEREAGVQTAPAPTVAEAPAPPPQPPKPQSAGLGTYFVKAENGANLRDAPSAQGKVIAALPTRTQVSAAPEGSTGWYRVRHAGKDGFVLGSLLSSEQPAAIVARRAEEKPVQTAAAAPPRRTADPNRSRYLSAVASNSAFQRSVAAERSKTTAALATAYDTMRS